MDEGQQVVTLDLEFGQGYRLTGTVLRSGEPLAGAMIYVSASGSSWNGRATTSHEGIFELDGLAEGTYTVSIRNPLSGLSDSQEVEVQGDEDVTIDLALGRISGRVRDASGSEPIEGAQIVLESMGSETTRSFGSRVTSDVEGYFNVGEVTAGRWKVTARKAGYAPAHREVEVGAGDDLRDLDLLLEPTERLRFEVANALGVAPVDVRVALLDPAGNRVGGGRYETTRGGRVEITTAPKGNWEMLVQAASGGVARVPASVPGDLGRLVLPEAGDLEVMVTDLEGDPVAAQVTVTGADGRTFHSLDWRGYPVSSPVILQGKVTLNGLNVGTWNVVVRADDGRQWSGTASVRAGEKAQVSLQ